MRRRRRRRVQRLEYPPRLKIDLAVPVVERHGEEAEHVVSDQPILVFAFERGVAVRSIEQEILEVDGTEMIGCDLGYRLRDFAADAARGEERYDGVDAAPKPFVRDVVRMGVGERREDDD